MKKKRKPKIEKRTISAEELRRMRESGELRVPTRLLHESLTAEQEALARYTYKHAGRYLYGNYEQWEAGFLRERDPASELVIWMRIAAVLQYLAPSNDNTAKDLIGAMAVGNPTTEINSAWDAIKEQSADYIQRAFDDWENEFRGK